MGERERVGGGGDQVGSEAGGGEKVEELTEAKWVLRVLGIEAESELKEDQLPEEDEVGEGASLSVFQIAEGCDFLLISWLKYSLLALCCNQTTRSSYSFAFLIFSSAFIALASAFFRFSSSCCALFSFSSSSPPLPFLAPSSSFFHLLWLGMLHWWALSPQSLHVS